MGDDRPTCRSQLPVKWLRDLRTQCPHQVIQRFSRAWREVLYLQPSLQVYIRCKYLKLKTNLGFIKAKEELTLIELWNNLRADLTQGIANSQMEPWNNLRADLSQDKANSQMEPWNNLWADLSQDIG